MILITVTQIKEKVSLVLKVFLLLLLLGLLVPKLYIVLSDAGSLERWAEKEPVLEEPMRVEQMPVNEKSPFGTYVVDTLR
ncbi:MAG: hypothetical protein ACOYI2_08695 [Bacillota bacterium]